MNRTELAKFLSGAEAFHAFVHAFLWLSGNTFTVFGITATARWNVLGAIANAAISLALGLYGWRRRVPWEAPRRL